MNAKEKVKFILEFHDLDQKVLDQNNHFIVKLAAYILYVKYRYSIKETSKAINKVRQTTTAYINDIEEYNKKAGKALEKKINKIIKKIYSKEFM